MLVVLTFFSASISCLEASYIVRRGDKYIISFFPITINSTHIDEKALKLALTLQTKVIQTEKWGYIIFDTKLDNKDLTKWLIELELNPEFRDMVKKQSGTQHNCCLEKNFISKVRYIVGMMSLNLALHTQNVLSLHDKDFSLKQHPTTPTGELLHKMSDHNIYEVHDLSSVQLLQFLVKYFNWQKVVVVTEDQKEMDKLWIALNGTCSFHTGYYRNDGDSSYIKKVFEDVRNFINNCKVLTPSLYGHVIINSVQIYFQDLIRIFQSSREQGITEA